MPTMASSSLPLSGVRVFLHVRNAPESREKCGGGHSASNSNDTTSSSISAKEALRTLRRHVSQLGATLALSEAAADLVVSHNGSPAFLEAASAKFKTVVSPAFLEACIAADQRVGVVPYVVVAPAATAPSSASVGTASVDTPSPPRRSLRRSAASPSAEQKTGATVSAKKQGNAATRPASPSSSARRTGARAASTTSAAASSTVTLKPRQLFFLDDEGSESTAAPTAPANTHEAAGKADEQPPQVQTSCSPRAHVTHPGSTTLLFQEVDVNASRAKRRQPHRAASSPVAAVRESTRRSAPPRRRGMAAAPSQEEATVVEHITSHPQPPLLTVHTTTETASSLTPRLTPVAHCDPPTGPPSLPPSQDARDDEELIRHAVLRCTVTQAVTRRRGRPPARATSSATLKAAKAEAAAVTTDALITHDSSRSPLRIDGVTPSSSSLSHWQSSMSMEGQARDPFLASLSNARQQHQQQQSPQPSSQTASLSASGELVPTQQLAIPAPTPLAPSSSQPPQSPSLKRHRVASSGGAAPTDIGEVKSPQRRKPRTALTKAAANSTASVAPSPPLPPSTRGHRRVSRLPAKRHRHDSQEGDADLVEPADLPPPLMTFSEVSLLQPLDHDAAANVCVRLFMEDGGEGDGSAATARAQAAFLCDVVEQLGGVCVMEGRGQDDEDGVWADPSRRGRSCHHSSSGVVHAVSARKATHLVVHPRAVLTPDILYFKAFGIPIVTPQWVCDAIALGCFPAVVPHLHAHPVYGDVAAAVSERGEDSGAMQACVAHDEVQECAEPPQPQQQQSLLGGEDDLPEKVSEAPLPQPATGVTCASHSRHNTTTQKASVAAAPRSAYAARNATLRQLHKEVADEYVPAGEQATRPYYRPIFRDRMFYLYVPPVDLAKAAAAVAQHRSAGSSTRKRCRGSSSSSGSGGSHLGDVTAALEQAAQLIRLLGGTVTRNLESTYLDVAVDLTGFYEQTVEAGQRKLQQQQQVLRTLRESLSCAYHDALQRLSQVPMLPTAVAAAVAPPPAAADGSVTACPPIVGIAWLLHSVLTRQWTSVTPFVLSAHPLTAALTAAHCLSQAPLKQPQRQRSCNERNDAAPQPSVNATDLATVPSRHLSQVVSSAPPLGAAVTAPVEHHGTPSFSDSSTSRASTPASSSPAMPLSSAAVAVTPPALLASTLLSPTAAEAESSDTALWTSMTVVPQRKPTRGPQAAVKQAAHQLDTQEIAVMLGGASSASTRWGSGDVNEESASSWMDEQSGTVKAKESNSSRDIFAVRVYYSEDESDS